jgi:putative membrane protein
MRIEELLDARGLQAIEAAVSAAERTTSGEIVPILVERSDGYAEVRFGAAALIAFALGGVALFFAPSWWAWLVPAQGLVFLVATWLFRQRALLRQLVPKSIQVERVERAASLAFHDAGLIETRDRTGILIFVSLLEHRVVVLADRGIHARVEVGTWDVVVERIIAGIRARRAEEGLADGIRICGDILAGRFPPRTDDTNELPDAPRGRR